MFLTARGVIKRRWAEAAAKAKEAGQAIAGAADQAATAVGDEKRTLAERARAEFLAGYDRFMAALHALEADSEGAAVDVLAGIDRPVEAIGQALERAQKGLEGDEAGARQVEHADDQAARVELDPPL